MSHPVYRVRSFEIASAYTLRIRFDDATEQTIDFRPVLAGELYGPLRDVELFNQVRIDSEVETLPGAGSASRPKLGPARSPLTRRYLDPFGSAGALLPLWITEAVGEKRRRG